MFTLDARIAYNFTKNIWLAVSATNIQSSTTPETAGPSVERLGYLSLGARF